MASEPTWGTPWTGGIWFTPSIQTAEVSLLNVQNSLQKKKIYGDLFIYNGDKRYWFQNRWKQTCVWDVWDKRLWSEIGLTIVFFSHLIGNPHVLCSQSAVEYAYHRNLTRLGWHSCGEWARKTEDCLIIQPTSNNTVWAIFQHKAFETTNYMHIICQLIHIQVSQIVHMRPYLWI